MLDGPLDVLQSNSILKYSQHGRDYLVQWSFKPLQELSICILSGQLVLVSDHPHSGKKIKSYIKSSSHFSSLYRSSWITALPISLWITSTDFVSFANLLIVHPFPSYRLLTKRFDSISLYTKFWGMWLIICH